ncbi:MAG: CPBP family intramembrane metalloprotease [Planctomycetes bacterium]|nr:CPBP family intramembrane metalloprotease [Planctomycetota bacterium]
MLLTADSLVEKALDPSRVEIAHDALWGVFGAALACVLVGLFLLWLAIRKFGKPGGDLRHDDLIVAYPVSIGAVGVYLTLISWLWTRSPLEAGVAQSVLALACLLFVAFNPWRPAGQAPADWIKPRPLHLALAPLLWALAVPVLVAGMFAAVALAQITDMPVTMQDRLGELRSRSDPAWIIGWYVAAAVGAPLLEEFVFRVVLFGGLMGLLKPYHRGEGWAHPGTWIALLISGGLFVLAHGVWDWTVGIIPLSVLTFVLSAIYLHTRSVWAGVLVHAIHNGFVVTMQFYVLM